MQLISHSFKDGEPIPGEFAFAVIDPQHHIALSANRNPHLMWSDVPPGTMSFALICHDYDVPMLVEDVNKEGRSISISQPRDTFFHWILVDLPANVREIPAGSHSNGITPHGKPGPEAPQNALHGVNDYTKWFASDENMKGAYHGYDGPCPPWNDLLIHHYVFTLFALDVSHLEIKGEITGQSTRSALNGHVLGSASLTGTYSLNPEVSQRTLDMRG
jgi:Raf kinase inhibitor-like YbhB/YbcL family protein